MVQITHFSNAFPPHSSQYGEAIHWIEYIINQQLTSNYGIIQSGMYVAVISGMSATNNNQEDNMKCERCKKHKATWTAYREAAFGVIVASWKICGWCKRKMGA